MRLVGYGRVSQDDQESSLPNQRRTCEGFCESTDNDEYGDRHEFVAWFSDENVSGWTHPIDSEQREGFQALVEFLAEHSDVGGVVFKSFSRLSRSATFQMRIRDELEEILDRNVVLLQAEPWMFGLRELPNFEPDAYKQATSPMEEFFRKKMFLEKQFYNELEIIMSMVRTREGLQSQKESGGALGSNPRGLVTPNLAYEDSTDTSRYVPTEEVDPEQRRQWEAEHNQDWWEGHTPLADVIEMLTVYAEAGTSPMENYADPVSAGKMADRLGWSGGTTAVRNVWEAGAEYVEIALQYEDAHDFEVSDALRERFDVE